MKADNMINKKYSEILRLNKDFDQSKYKEVYKISVLSNITVNQLKEICEYCLRSNKINASVSFGNYDNIVQDSSDQNDSNLVIIFWELANIVNGLQYRIEHLNNSELNEITNKVKAEIDLVLKNLERNSLVLINNFSSYAFTYQSRTQTLLDNLADQLNLYLQTRLKANFKLVNIEKILVKEGITKCFDFRYYYSSKALYTVDFFKEYVSYILPSIFAATGRTKKVLVFDCDNTLWKGILGEDGFNGIQMSDTTKDGAIFSEVQLTALKLNRMGVILCLCSKNNKTDIEHVINNHPDFQLNHQNITINKSNWQDKAQNLIEISNELNIGLDSMVFVDDSDFEVNLIRERLPDVSVFQVPKRLYEYPLLIKEVEQMFLMLSNTKEDLQRSQMYKEQILRNNLKHEFNNIDEYLSSLKLSAIVHVDNQQIIERVSQMTQKTNQFNLTTNRYTEADIRNFVLSPQYMVVAMSGSDKYGDYGITGLIIINFLDTYKDAYIDTFLMSCRILGRNFELTIFDFLINRLREKNIKTLYAKYKKTVKNSQVHSIYDKLSFELLDKSEEQKDYKLELDNYKLNAIDYITIKVL